MKKIFILLFIISSLYANKSEYQTAKEMFEKKQYQSAIKIFTKLIDKDLGNEKYNFYLGRSYYELKEFEKASIHFERLLIINENNLRARTELAQTYLMLGLNQDAKYNFKLVLQNNIPANVKANIEKQLEFLENKEKKHLFSALLGFGVTYDSNVNNVSNLSTFNTPLYSNLELTDKKESDINYLGFINGTHLYKIDEKLNIRNSLRYAKQVFKDEKDKNLDLIAYNFFLQHSMKRKSLIYGLNFATIDLDKKGYLDTKGFSIKYIKQLYDNIYSHLAFKYNIKEFKQASDKNLDSNNYQLILGNSMPTDKYGKFNFTYSYLNELMKKDDANNSDKIKHLVLIGNNYSINSKTNWLSNFSITNSKEKDNDATFLKKRTDNLFSISTGISYNISKSLNLSSNIKYIKNNSNIDIYTYDKQTIDFFIKKAF